MQDSAFHPQRVAVGSTNPAKTEAVRQAFEALDDIGGFTLVAVACDTDTAQPWGESATRSGALARAEAARADEEADWGIGLEGGLVNDDKGVLVTSWIAACQADAAPALVRSAGFYLPRPVAERVRTGVTLEEAWQRLDGRQAIGRDSGTVGALSGERFDRTRLYREAVILAVALLLGH